MRLLDCRLPDRCGTAGLRRPRYLRRRDFRRDRTERLPAWMPVDWMSDAESSQVIDLMTERVQSRAEARRARAPADSVHDSARLVVGKARDRARTRRPEPGGGSGGWIENPEGRRRLSSVSPLVIDGSVEGRPFTYSRPVNEPPSNTVGPMAPPVAGCRTPFRTKAPSGALYEGASGERVEFDFGRPCGSQPMNVPRPVEHEVQSEQVAVSGRFHRAREVARGLRRIVLAARHLEGCDAGLEVERSGAGVVLLGVPEGAVGDRVDAHGRVVAPAVGAQLGAAARDHLDLSAGQAARGISAFPRDVADRGVGVAARDAVAEGDVALAVHRDGPHPAVLAVGRRVGAVLELHPAPARVAQLGPVDACDVGAGGVHRGVHEQGVVRSEVAVLGPVHLELVDRIQPLARRRAAGCSCG